MPSWQAAGSSFPARKSYVVALRYLRVSQERNSLFLSVTAADLANIPLMPDNQYLWLSDEAWLEPERPVISRSDPKQDRER